VDLHAQVSGYLEKVTFTEGDRVETGKLLYQIEQAPYRAVVKANRAWVAQAKATHTLDLQYLKRLKSVDTGGVSETDIESAESEAASALAALQEAEAALLQSEINLGYTRIEAPITGVIGKNDFTKGNLVSPDFGTLSRIVQIHPIRVVFSISETRLPQMKRKRLVAASDPLQKDGVFKIRFPNGETYPLSGRLAFFDNEVDDKTGTLALRVEFDNPDGFLVPGQYVTILAKMDASRKMPVIPQGAVLEDREGR
jgi:RND family efflux transporter MFP subunit